MRSTYKTIGLWVILIALFVAFYNVFSGHGEPVQQLSFTQFMGKVEEEKIRRNPMAAGTAIIRKVLGALKF